MFNLNYSLPFNFLLFFRMKQMLPSFKSCASTRLDFSIRLLLRQWCGPWTYFKSTIRCRKICSFTWCDLFLSKFFKMTDLNCSVKVVALVLLFGAQIIYWEKCWISMRSCKMTDWLKNFIYAFTAYSHETSLSFCCCIVFPSDSRKTSMNIYIVLMKHEAVWPLQSISGNVLMLGNLCWNREQKTFKSPQQIHSTILSDSDRADF